MNRVSRPAVLSAICVSALLATGCSSAPPQSGGTGSAAGGSGRSAVQAEASTDPSPTLPVSPAGPGDDDSAKVTRTTGTTRNVTGSGVQLSSYDAGKRRAVLSGSRGRAPKVRTGDVIASPATRELPKGALVKVTEVRSTDGEKTEVATAPANLTELFGNAQAQGAVPVDPAAWKVEPLVKGLDVKRRPGVAAGGGTGGSAAPSAPASPAGTPGGNGPSAAPGPDAAQSSAAPQPGGTAKAPAGKEYRHRFGTLRLGMDTPLPLPEVPGAPKPEVELGGFVELSPEVAFSYSRNSATDIIPAKASVELKGGYKAGWRLKGELNAKTGPLRVPFAKLAASPVIMVGPVPVVVNVGLTLYYEVNASGEVSLRMSQDVKGAVTIGAQYVKGDGWKPDVRADGTPTPVSAKLTGKGEVRAAIAAEAAIGLYDSVGISATFTPYLRGEAEGTVTPRSARGSWALYGGVGLDGALFARLAVFGTPLFERRITIPIFHREWPITKGRFPRA
ncbi:hypothetical protein ACFYYR_15900 [Streptomyces sp. NPDC001922]|uniref:hypothetical protein n=1 Tax=Streptomyces sp. NPDC001922 TaxID=3364624 RepID=UPI0036749277